MILMMRVTADHCQSLLSHEVSAVLDNATQEVDTSDVESELGMEN